MNPLIELPIFVRSIIDELISNKVIISIWLIGSRANGKASENSDWDILVFSEEPVRPTARRHSDIDVIRIDPQGRGLVKRTE